MTLSELDPVDQLLLAEIGTVDRALVVDAPDLARHLAEHTTVVAWCDNWTLHHDLPSQIAIDNLTEPEVDVVAYHLPQSLGELDEMAGIGARIGARLLGGARIKHLNHSMNSVLFRYYRDVSASLGVRKARVLRGLDPVPAPSPWPKKRHHEDLDLWIAAHGGTFAGTKIDPGTRLLINHLDQVKGDRVVDLGCGNGTLAVLLARSGHQVRATDVSWAAVAATDASAALNGLDIDVIWANGLDAIEDSTADAIVSNPPFHQGRAKESSPTLAMFADAARALAPGGEFWCVFNSHLPWHHRLRQLVGPTQVVSRTPGYTLTRSVSEK